MPDDLAAYLYELATTGAVDDEMRTRVMVLDAAHAIEAGAPADVVLARLVLAGLCDPWARRVAEAARGLALQSPGRGSARSPDTGTTEVPAAESSSRTVRQET